MPKTSINYQNTIIYKIVCNDTSITDCYVGHTTDFIRRKNSHKCRCTKENNEAYNFKVYEFIRENGGWNNWSMILIENFPCNNLLEANRRERYWIENLNSTLNIFKPTRTRKEYKQDNEEKIKEYLKNYCSTNEQKEKRKNYRIENKEKIKEYKKKKIVCDVCGTLISRNTSMLKHKRSKKCLNHSLETT